MTREGRVALRRTAFLGLGAVAALGHLFDGSDRVAAIASRSASDEHLDLLQTAAGKRFVGVLRPMGDVDVAEVHRIREAVAGLRPSAVLAVGGGAVMDVAKAVARPSPRLVLVPTTLSGSEHTGNTAWWEDGHKVVSSVGMADAVVADPRLLVDRVDVLTAGAIHALAHVLATLSQAEPPPGARDTVVTAAEELVTALRDNSTDFAGRARFQRGAWLAAVGFGLTGPRIGPHHFLVHHLGGPGDHARASSRLLCASIRRSGVYRDVLQTLDTRRPGLGAAIEEVAETHEAAFRTTPLHGTHEVVETLPKSLRTNALAILAARGPDDD
jgi:alcohol dehydrogenase class IV